MTKLWVLKPNFGLQGDYRYWIYNDVDDLMVFADTEEEARKFAGDSHEERFISWRVESNVVGVNMNFSVENIWQHPHLTTCEEMMSERGTVWKAVD